MRRAVRVEAMKLASSTVGIATGLLLAVVLPLMGLAFYSVAVNGGTGPLAAKAAAFIVGDGWDGYLGTIGQIAAVAMFLGVGVLAAWDFGREYSDGTFSSLFALPVTKKEVASAKFVVLTAWFVVVSVLTVGITLMLGLVAGVGEFGGNPGGSGIVLLAVCVLSALLGLPAGLAASIGKDYLSAIGAIIVIIAVSQVVVLLGTGGWFPFAVPGLIAIRAGDGAPEVSAGQIALVPMLSLLLMVATVQWWHRAESV